MMTASIRELLKKHDIRMTKSLGQNFLIDESIVASIVEAAEVGPEDLVIEVGPGVGSMTGLLAHKAGKVVAIEIDRHLIPALKEVVMGLGNVEIVNQDILKVDLGQLVKAARESLEPSGGERKVKVVANLPYYITTPIVMKFLEENPGVDKMVFMVQKEVAGRMAAKPGGKDYGALSVAVQYYANPRIAFDVGAHCFIPQPEVESTVVCLDILKEPPVQVEDPRLFFRTVKAAFGQRRKTLLNALSNSGSFTENKEQIRSILNNLGINENQRGETLTIMQFAQLSNAFAGKTSPGSPEKS